MVRGIVVVTEAVDVPEIVVVRDVGVVLGTSVAAVVIVVFLGTTVVEAHNGSTFVANEPITFPAA